MNYTYEIIEQEDNSLYLKRKVITIIELLDLEYQESWYLNFLKQKDMNHFAVSHLRNSFQRTKQWILENHPELLL